MTDLGKFLLFRLDGKGNLASNKNKKPAQHSVTSEELLELWLHRQSNDAMTLKLHGRSIRETITIEEVRTQTRKSLDPLFTDHTRLRMMLYHHQEILQKGWNKKAVNQKREVLSHAWADMNELHRPHFHVLRNQQRIADAYSRQATSSAVQIKAISGSLRKQNKMAAVQYPHVNMEDLSADQ